jgi:hypothetical protein
MPRQPQLRRTKETSWYRMCKVLLLDAIINRSRIYEIRNTTTTIATVRTFFAFEESSSSDAARLSAAPVSWVPRQKSVQSNPAPSNWNSIAHVPRQSTVSPSRGTLHIRVVLFFRPEVCADANCTVQYVVCCTSRQLAAGR